MEGDLAALASSGDDSCLQAVTRLHDAIKSTGKLPLPADSIIDAAATRLQRCNNEELARSALDLLVDVAGFAQTLKRESLSVLLPEVIGCMKYEGCRLPVMGFFTVLSIKPQTLTQVVAAIVKFGLIHSDASVREASALTIQHVLRKSNLGVDFKALLAALAARLRDDDPHVVIAAEKALGYMQRINPEYNQHLKKLDYAFQQFVQAHSANIEQFAKQGSAASRRTLGSAFRRNPSSPRATNSPLTSEPQVNSVHSSAAIDQAPEMPGTGDAATISAEPASQSTSHERRTSLPPLMHGCIPAELYGALTDMSGWQSRGEEVEKLLDILRSIVSGESSPLGFMISRQSLARHTQGLLGLCASLLQDTRFRVLFPTLQAIELILELCDQHVRHYIAIVLPPLLSKLGDNKVIIRQACLKTLGTMMTVVGARIIVDSVSGYLQHQQWRVRENALKVIMVSFLNDKASSVGDRLDVVDVVRSISPLLRDRVDKVCTAAVEALAVIHDKCQANHSVMSILSNTPPPLPPEVLRFVSERLKSTTLPLPSLTPDGLLEMPTDVYASGESSVYQSYGSHVSIDPHSESLEASKGPSLTVDTSDNGRNYSSINSVKSSRHKIPFDMPRSRAGSRARSAKGLGSAAFSAQSQPEMSAEQLARASGASGHTPMKPSSPNSYNRRSPRSQRTITSHTALPEKSASMSVSPFVERSGSRLALDIPPVDFESYEKQVLNVVQSAPHYASNPQWSRSTSSDPSNGHAFVVPPQSTPLVVESLSATPGSAEAQHVYSSGIALPSRSPNSSFTVKTNIGARQLRAAALPAATSSSGPSQSPDDTKIQLWLPTVNTSLGDQPPAAEPHLGQASNAPRAADSVPQRSVADGAEAYVPTQASTAASRRGTFRQARTRDGPVQGFASPSRAHAVSRPQQGFSKREPSSERNGNSSGSQYDVDVPLDSQSMNRGMTGVYGQAAAMHIYTAVTTPQPSHITPKMSQPTLTSRAKPHLTVTTTDSASPNDSASPTSSLHDDLETSGMHDNLSYTDTDDELPAASKAIFSGNATGGTSRINPAQPDQWAASISNAATQEQAEPQSPKGRTQSAVFQRQESFHSAVDPALSPERVSSLRSKSSMSAQPVTRQVQHYRQLAVVRPRQDRSRRAASASSRVQAARRERMAAEGMVDTGDGGDGVGLPAKALTPSSKLYASQSRRREWDTDPDPIEPMGEFTDDDEPPGDLQQPMPQESPQSGHDDDRPIRPMRNMHAIYSFTADESVGDGAPAPSQPHPQPPVRRKVSRATVARRARHQSQQRQPSIDDTAETESSVASTSPRSVSAIRSVSSARMRAGSGTPSATSAAGSEHLYTKSEDLQPCRSPDADLRRAMSELTSDSWEAQFEACNTIRRLALHHPSKLAPHLGTASHALLKLMDSLRSSVSRVALMTVTDLLKGLGRGMDSEIELIAPMLMKKAADTNTFLCEEATKALTAMIQNCGGTRVLTALLGCSSHKVSSIRVKAAPWLDAAVQHLGPRVAQSRELSRVFKAAVHFTQEGREEARHAGKRLVVRLYDLKAMDDRHAAGLIDDRKLQQVKKVVMDGMDLAISTMSPSNDSNSVSKESSTTSVPRSAMSTSSKPSFLRRKNTGAASASSTTAQSREELKMVTAKLHSNDWRERANALAELVRLAADHPDFVSAYSTQVMDELAKKIGDPNWKVAQAALTATERLLPLLESQVDATLPLLVPALAGAVISTQRSVATAASSVVERIHDTVDPRALLPSALNLLSVGNSKIRPVALQMILVCVPKLSSKATIIQRQILPAVFNLLSEAKKDVRSGTEAVLRSASEAIGSHQVLAAAATLPQALQDRVKAIIQ